MSRHDAEQNVVGSRMNAAVVIVLMTAGAMSVGWQILAMSNDGEGGGTISLSDWRSNVGILDKGGGGTTEGGAHADNGGQIVQSESANETDTGDLSRMRSSETPSDNSTRAGHGNRGRDPTLGSAGGSDPLPQSHRGKSKGHVHTRGESQVSGALRGGNMSFAVDDSEGDVLKCKPKGQDPFPFLSQDANGNGRWPLVGWAKMKLHDPDFQSSFKFYLLDGPPYLMDDAMACFQAQWQVPDMNSPEYKVYDDKLSLVQRLYIPEMAVWPALKNHPMRTFDPDKADLFVLGWSPLISQQLTKRGQRPTTRPPQCSKIPTDLEVWEKQVADALMESPQYRKKGGQDHLIFWTKYGLGVRERLKVVLDGGILVAATDRHFWSLYHNLPTPFGKGSVIIIPYVASSYVDSDEKFTAIHARNKTGWFFFRGNYKRRGGSRDTLAQIAEHLTGADFEHFRFGGPDAKLLRRSAELMRSAAVCPSPQGDAPTSGRFFEALAVGCVPVVSSPPKLMKGDLPFPSLIDYDTIALHTPNFGQVVQSKQVDEFGKVPPPLVFEAMSAPDGDAECMLLCPQKLEGMFGPRASRENLERLECMSKEGIRVYREHMSYFRNPLGITNSILFESWMHLQKRGLITGRHTPQFERPPSFERWRKGQFLEDAVEKRKPTDGSLPLHLLGLDGPVGSPLEKVVGRGALRRKLMRSLRRRR